MLSSLAEIRQEAESLLVAGTPVETVRLALLGRKGRLTLLLRSLSELPLAERITLGKEANTLKLEIEALLLSQGTPSEATLELDVTLPSFRQAYGSQHPISFMAEKMVRIFQDLSFEVVEGAELVGEWENFEALNISTDHPARDGHKTLFLAEDLLLRTQTTALQVPELSRRLKEKQLPIRIVMPGKTYRRESDQTHSPMFHQFDAVMVDNQTTFSDLHGILDYFCKRLFGDMVETRFRPHYFPFTEPSAEIDIRWKGERTSTGKHTEWLEMGGCGMIHPEVLKRAGLNPKVYQGWAFGMSIDRPVMVLNQIADLRRLYQNELPFLRQFSHQR